MHGLKWFLLQNKDLIVYKYLSKLFYEALQIVFHTVPKFILRMMTYGPQTFKSIFLLELVIFSVFSQLFKKYRTRY